MQPCPHARESTFPLPLPGPRARRSAMNPAEHSSLRLQTRAIHAGAPSPRLCGAVNVPIFQSSVFEQQRVAAYADIVYPRLSTTPTHLALGRKLAALEGAELAFASASGMSAITTAILTVLG